MKMKINKETTIKIITDLNCQSIVAQVVSLQGQIKDFGYKLTEKQLKELSEIEEKLHKLVGEITHAI